MFNCEFVMFILTQFHLFSTDAPRGMGNIGTQIAAIDHINVDKNGISFFANSMDSVERPAINMEHDFILFPCRQLITLRFEDSYSSNDIILSDKDCTMTLPISSLQLTQSGLWKLLSETEKKPTELTSSCSNGRSLEFDKRGANGSICKTLDPRTHLKLFIKHLEYPAFAKIIKQKMGALVTVESCDDSSSMGLSTIGTVASRIRKKGRTRKIEINLSTNKSPEELIEAVRSIYTRRPSTDMNSNHCFSEGEDVVSRTTTNYQDQTTENAALDHTDRSQEITYTQDVESRTTIGSTDHTQQMACTQETHSRMSLDSVDYTQDMTCTQDHGSRMTMSSAGPTQETSCTKDVESRMTTQDMSFTQDGGSRMSARSLVESLHGMSYTQNSVGVSPDGSQVNHMRHLSTPSPTSSTVPTKLVKSHKRDASHLQRDHADAAEITPLQTMDSRGISKGRLTYNNHGPLDTLSAVWRSLDRSARNAMSLEEYVNQPRVQERADSIICFGESMAKAVQSMNEMSSNYQRMLKCFSGNCAAKDSNMFDNLEWVNQTSVMVEQNAEEWAHDRISDERDIANTLWKTGNTGNSHK